LNLNFNPASQKELLLARQRYGIDFYGVHNGEILVIVDLFSGKTMLEFLASMKMESVSQTIIKKIIFSRGVPDELRSDNAPARTHAGNGAASVPILGHSTDSNQWPQPARQYHLREG
jgi:hypothetical protein